MTCSGLNDWVTTNYKYLSKMAKDYSNDSVDLVSYYYIFLHDRGWDKIEPLNHNDQMKFSRVWLRNTAKWDNIEMSKMRVNNLPEELNIEDTSHTELEILIGAEMTSDTIKEWLVDMTNEWGDKVDKLTLIKYHYHKSLSLQEQILYDLTYTEMLTTRQVSSRLNIPHTACHYMIVDLKNKLIKLCSK